MQAHEYQGLTSQDIGFIHGLRLGLEKGGASQTTIESECRSFANMFRRVNELEVERVWLNGQRLFAAMEAIEITTSKA